MPFKREDYALESGKLQAYAWPGGYPLYYLAADGEVLCADCASLPECVAADNDSSERDWHIVGAGINDEDDSMYCAHCNKHIESAYGEPESEDVSGG